MKLKRRWIYIILGVPLLSLAYCVVFFCNKDTDIMAEYEKLDYGEIVIYISCNYLDFPIERSELDKKFSVTRNYSELNTLLGKATMIYIIKPPNPQEAASGHLVYLLNPQDDNPDDRTKYGLGIMVVFNNGRVVDWDVIGNGIEIEPYTTSELDSLLHGDLSIDDVEQILGTPSMIRHADGIVSLYTYVFDTKATPSMFGGLRNTLMVHFEDGVFSRYTVAPIPVPDWSLLHSQMVKIAKGK